MNTAEDSAVAIRHTVYYIGRVQGVGFRYTVEAVSTKFAVTGLVRNLRDGRVELVAEGAAEELARFRSAVRQAMHRNIDDIESSESPATGEFSTFSIAF